MPRPRDLVMRRLARLPRGLREHVQRARQEARDMALCFGVDEERVDLAVAAHDIARAVPPAELLAQARRYGLVEHPVEEQVPILLHGPVAARWLRREAGLEDEEICQAVRWHTTAQCGLGTLGKILFLADKLDPEKEQHYPQLSAVRRLAQRDLDGAMLAFLEHELAALLSRGEMIHPASIEARNELLLKARRG